MEIKELDFKREQAYFDWLNKRRAVLHSGVVHTSDEVGLSRASQNYQEAHSKGRCEINSTKSVLYVEISKPGRIRDLFDTLLEELLNPLASEPLRDLRKRTWATLEDHRIEMILVDHAESLSFEAMKEIIHIKTHCKISMVLLGSFQLKKILSRRKYASIYNHFLNFHIF